MKRILVAILVVTMLFAALPGVTGCTRKSRLKDWYNVSLDVYREGLKTNWANEEEYKSLNIADDLKGSKVKGIWNFSMTEIIVKGIHTTDVHLTDSLHSLCYYINHPD